MLVHDIIEQDGSMIWVATDKHGCYKCRFTVVNDIPTITEIEEIQFIEPFNNKSSIFSMSMGEDDSTMWFASRGNGVLSYNINTGKSRVIQFSTNDGLATNETFYITKTEEMMFATGNGIVTYSSKENNVSIPDFVPKKAIHSILPDGNGYIWITTNSGIISLDSELNYHTSFNRFYGMEVLEYSDGACFRDDKSGRLFFGGINGFTVIDEDTVHNADSATYKPDLHITNFIQNNEFSHISQKMVKGKLRLPYTKSIFAIEYSLIDNLNYPDYMIKYQIDGYNNEWITNQSDNIIYLPALNPGNYKLKVKYINLATSYESDECCLHIYIIPPTYKRWYAFLLYGLLVILGIVLLVRYLMHKYTSMKDRLKKRYEKEIMKVKSETTNTITEELSVQITFMLGLCQQIRQQTQNNQYITSKVNLIEYNIAKTNKILHILNEYKGISESITSYSEVDLIHVSNIANEMIEIMKSSTSQKNVTLSHDIERDIIISMNMEGFLTLFNTLIYKIIAITSGTREIHLQIKRSEKGGLYIRLSATAEIQTYEEMAATMENYERQVTLMLGENDENIRNFEFILCRRLVKEMNGTLTYNYMEESGCLKIGIELPQSNIGESQITYVDSPISENINTLNTLVENMLPEKGRTSRHMKHVFLISANKEISSFMSYFLSEKYGIYEYTDNESALQETRNQIPEVIIYHVSSMVGKFADFMEKIKGNKRTSQVPVIALTSSLQIAEREECIKQGADLCITFPFNIDYLHSALEKILNKHKSIADYYKSSISTYVMNEGKIIHRDDKEFINNILKIIEDNLSNPALSASMIARLMGMSTRVMYRRLEGITDTTLHKIIKDSRMEFATRLLSSSKMTIDEIMYKVGYDNRSTFYRNFKESKGITPKEYREKIQDNVIQSLS